MADAGHPEIRGSDLGTRSQGGLSQQSVGEGNSHVAGGGRSQKFQQFEVEHDPNVYVFVRVLIISIIIYRDRLILVSVFNLDAKRNLKSIFMCIYVYQRILRC